MKNNMKDKFEIINIQIMIDTYNKNKSIRVNNYINCAVCGKLMIKKQHQQAFCVDNDHKCKNEYWNTVRSKKWKSKLK